MRFLITENSDIDMLIKDSNVSILTISNIQQQLMNVFDKKIDLLNENDISDVFRFLIRDDEVVIYEKQG